MWYFSIDSTSLRSLGRLNLIIVASRCIFTQVGWLLGYMWDEGVTKWYQNGFHSLWVISDTRFVSGHGSNTWTEWGEMCFSCMHVNVYMVVMHACQCLYGFYACIVMVMVVVHEFMVCSWCYHADVGILI